MKSHQEVNIFLKIQSVGNISLEKTVAETKILSYPENRSYPVETLLTKGWHICLQKGPVEKDTTYFSYLM